MLSFHAALPISVALTVIGVVPVSVAFVGAVLAIAALRLLPLPDLYSSIDWPVVVLLGAMIPVTRSEEHTSELQSLMRISYAVFCLKKKKTNNQNDTVTL